MSERFRYLSKERIYRQLFVVFGALYGSAIYFVLFNLEKSSKLRNAYLIIFLCSVPIGLLAGLVNKKKLQQFNIYTFFGVALFFILIRISASLRETSPTVDFQIKFFIYLGLALAVTAEIVVLSIITYTLRPKKETEEKEELLARIDSLVDKV